MAARTALRILDVRGGEKDNAIPAEAAARVAVADRAAALEALGEMESVFQKELSASDAAVFVRAAEEAAEGAAMDEASTARTLCLLTCAPNGVQTMSREIPGLVQTSLNLGILKTSEKAVSASFCIRSSLASEKEMVKDRLACLWSFWAAWWTFPESIRPGNIALILPCGS